MKIKEYIKQQFENYHKNIIVPLVNESGYVDSSHAGEFTGVDDEAVNDIWKAQGELGAKNLLVYPYNGGKSNTVNGMTYTVNNDGSVVLNGTSTDWTSFYLERGETLRDGEYIISSNELPKKVYLTFKNVDSGVEYLCTQGTQSIDLAFNENILYNVFFQTQPNVTLDNFVIYPMLRHAEDTDDTWQPYAPTNKELNESLHDNTDIIDISDSFYTKLAEGISISDAAVYKQGKHIFGNFVVNGLPVSGNATPLYFSFKPAKKILTYYYSNKYLRAMSISESSGVLQLAELSASVARIAIDYVCQ